MVSRMAGNRHFWLLLITHVPPIIWRKRCHLTIMKITMLDYNIYDYNYKILMVSHNISANIPVLREGTISWETVVACNKFFKSSTAYPRPFTWRGSRIQKASLVWKICLRHQPSLFCDFGCNKNEIILPYYPSYVPYMSYILPLLFLSS